MPDAGRPPPPGRSAPRSPKKAPPSRPDGISVRPRALSISGPARKAPPKPQSRPGPQQRSASRRGSPKGSPKGSPRASRKASPRSSPRANAKGACGFCNEQILATEPSLAVETNRGPTLRFHPTHFNCSKCGCTLRGVPWSETQSGDFLCESCLDGIRDKCAGCGHVLKSGMVNALNQAWHAECFVCHECRCQLVKGFMSHESKPYCLTDYHKLFSEKCSECEEPIKEKQVTALGRKFHPQCLKCVEGKHAIVNSFYTHNDQLYCIEHYESIMLPHCVVCDLPVKSDYTRTLKGEYHRECYGWAKKNQAAGRERLETLEQDLVDKREEEEKKRALLTDNEEQEEKDAKKTKEEQEEHLAQEDELREGLHNETQLEREAQDRALDLAIDALEPVHLSDEDDGTEEYSDSDSEKGFEMHYIRPASISNALVLASQAAHESSGARSGRASVPPGGRRGSSHRSSRRPSVSGRRRSISTSRRRSLSRRRPRSSQSNNRSRNSVSSAVRRTSMLILAKQRMQAEADVEEPPPFPLQLPDSDSEPNTDVPPGLPSFAGEAKPTIAKKKRSRRQRSAYHNNSKRASLVRAALSATDNQHSISVTPANNGDSDGSSLDTSLATGTGEHSASVPGSHAASDLWMPTSLGGRHVRAPSARRVVLAAQSLVPTEKRALAARRSRVQPGGHVGSPTPNQGWDGANADKSRLTLRQVMAALPYRAVLEEYLEKNLCGENLMFLTAVLNYAREAKADPALNEGMARIIWRTFLHPTEAVFLINMDSSTHSKLQERLDARDYSKNLYDEAYGVIYVMTSTDVFSRFRKSSEYYRMVSNLPWSMKAYVRCRRRCSFGVVRHLEDYSLLDKLALSIITLAKTKTHRLHLKKYLHCIEGGKLVAWLMDRHARDRLGALMLLQRMLETGLLKPIVVNANSRGEMFNGRFDVYRVRARDEIGRRWPSITALLKQKNVHYGTMIFKGVLYHHAWAIFSVTLMKLFVFRSEHGGPLFAVNMQDATAIFHKATRKVDTFDTSSTRSDHENEIFTMCYLQITEETLSREYLFLVKPADRIRWLTSLSMKIPVTTKDWNI